MLCCVGKLSSYVTCFISNALGFRREILTAQLDELIPQDFNLEKVVKILDAQLKDFLDDLAIQ